MEINEFVANFADQFEDTDPESITASTVFHDLEEWDSLVALAVLNMHQVISRINRNRGADLLGVGAEVVLCSLDGFLCLL